MMYATKQKPKQNKRKTDLKALFLYTLMMTIPSITHKYLHTKMRNTFYY